MKYIICEEVGSVYWKEGDEIACAPISQDGTFDTEESCIVETWEEVPVETKEKVINALK